ncbi:hypothetical protein [Deferrisoma camini]|uniref:hypothetical protein n=1 Tax=Deferrisoma camini TaxID=1035120 RepID=UPI00046D909F|nr:hypothetical protein [Deferrisoma camini]
MSPLDDTVARYDPFAALEDIAVRTGLDLKDIAQVLEGELDYLGCLGLLNGEVMDEATRREFEELRRENEDLLDRNPDGYDMDVAVSFIQRNRGIERDVILRVLQANMEFMERQGLLDEEWEEDWTSPPTTKPRP